MTIIDGRLGAIEGERSRTKRRSRLSLAGELRAEVSLPR
ncbi:hypothetical protein J2X36_001422 [Methylobacterium sp. BE186]|nr:hypothetical protein [Methylobacterium sp. BE186]